MSNPLYVNRLEEDVKTLRKQIEKQSAALKLARTALETCKEEFPGTRFKEVYYSGIKVREALTAIDALGE